MDSPLQTIFCAGCNERFRLAGATGVCPRCGAIGTGAREAELEDTLLIKDNGKRLRDSSGDGEAAEAIDRMIGKRIDVYRCEAFLGSGGMGRVYLAFHFDLERHCALKVLSRHLAARDPEYVRRFLDEGKSTASLVHPNIVTIHASGKEGDYNFLEMEFVAGRSLQQQIDEAGRLPPIRAMSLVVGIAEGLAAAHRNGIIHRDLKPDNVLLTQHGIPKIVDFGLAKRIQPPTIGPDSEDLCGTPYYMAPELFQGERATPASDVYALGVCLFVLLTGRHPFVAGSLRELAMRVTTEPLPSIRRENSGITLEMAECVGLLMARTPSNRPQDAIAAAQLLRAVLGQVRDLESLLQEAFRDEPDVTWSRSENRYRLVLDLPDGRRQTLFVESSDHSTTEKLLLIYSVCCPAQPDFYESALRLNSEFAHGGLAIRELDGTPMFVMVNTYLRATVDPEAIRRSVIEIGTHADAVELLLSGGDRH